MQCVGLLAKVGISYNGGILMRTAPGLKSAVPLGREIFECLGLDHIFLRLGLLHCMAVISAPTWELLFVGNQCDNAPVKITNIQVNITFITPKLIIGVLSRAKGVVGANQPVHWFLGGKGLGIQQETSVRVGLPKSKGA